MKTIILATLQPYPVLFTIKALVSQPMTSDAVEFYFSGVTKNNCPSPRGRAVKDLCV
jgi:hypothetical protein